MRKLFVFGLICLFLTGCESDTAQTMTVTGQVKGLKKGTLYLQHISDTTLTVIDSLEINGDGNFSFKTEVESPEIFYLYLNKKDNNPINDRITFFGEPGIITINTAWNTFDSKAKITGSKTHKKLEEYKAVMSRFNKENLTIAQGALDPKVQGDSLAIDSIQKAGDKNILRSYLYAINFALNNKDSHIAPFIALTEISDANKKYLDSIYTALPPNIADAKYGTALKKYLDEIDEQ